MDLTKSRYYKVIRAKQIVKKTAYPHRSDNQPFVKGTHKKTPQDNLEVLMINSLNRAN